MPIYEYECPRCGRFDALQKMSSAALEVHDVCGSRVKKLMSASSFALKGSGFYRNDYGVHNSAAIAGREEKPSQKKPMACEAGGCGSTAKAPNA